MSRVLFVTTRWWPVRLVVLQMRGGATVLTCLLIGVALATAKPISSIAVGSCNRHDDVRGAHIFETVLRLKSDLWIWLGDAVYGDVRRVPPIIWSGASFAVKKERYDAMKNRPDYAAMTKTVPVIGVWDDHDYGLNNAGSDYADRVMAQELYLDFVDEPKNSTRRKQAGIYASYTYGEAPNKVKVILIDNRYNRDPPGSDDADMLGEAQWAWLERELSNSDAAVHLIGNGIQIVPLEKPIQEKWSQFPASRARLLALIARARTPGVIFLSGDIHWAELYRTECSPVSYPLYELTTSGMTHSCETQVPFGLCKWAARVVMRDRQRIAHYTHLNFATVDFDWSARIVTLNLRGPDGDIKFSERLPLSLLQVSATEPIRMDWEKRTPDLCPPVAAWRSWTPSTFVALGLPIVALLLFAIGYGWYRLIRLCCAYGRAARPLDAPAKQGKSD